MSKTVALPPPSYPLPPLTPSLSALCQKFLPDSLCTLTRLIDINFSHNKIKVIPPGFNKLHKLIKLRLGNNAIAIIPDEITELKFLEVLALFSNNISELPPKIGASLPVIGHREQVQQKLTVFQDYCNR